MKSIIFALVFLIAMNGYCISQMIIVPDKSGLHNALDILGTGSTDISYMFDDDKFVDKGDFKYEIDIMIIKGMPKNYNTATKHIEAFNAIMIDIKNHKYNIVERNKVIIESNGELKIQNIYRDNHNIFLDIKPNTIMDDLEKAIIKKLTR